MGCSCSHDEYVWGHANSTAARRLDNANRLGLTPANHAIGRVGSQYPIERGLQSTPLTSAIRSLSSGTPGRLGAERRSRVGQELDWLALRTRRTRNALRTSRTMRSRRTVLIGPHDANLLM